MSGYILPNESSDVTVAVHVCTRVQCVLLILPNISPFSYLYKNEIQSIDRQAFKGLVALEQL